MVSITMLIQSMFYKRALLLHVTPLYLELIFFNLALCRLYLNKQYICKWNK